MTRNMIRTCQGQEPANPRSGPWAAWADALFVSMLQCSDRPTTGQARQAIAAAIHAYSGRGCAERVAQEFGDHPETAVVRMRWALAVASECSDQHERLSGADIIAGRPGSRPRGVAQHTYVNYLTYMSDGPDVVAAQELRVAIGRVARRLRQLYATERESAASFIELGILVRLEREGPTSPTTLAAGEGVTSQAVAGVVRELERRALVERTGGQEDRRRVTVAITGAGRELLVSRENAVVDAMIRALADEYTPAERRQLESAVPLLNRLATRL